MSVKKYLTGTYKKAPLRLLKPRRNSVLIFKISSKTLEISETRTTEIPFEKKQRRPRQDSWLNHFFKIKYPNKKTRGREKQAH